MLFDEHRALEQQDHHEQGPAQDVEEPAQARTPILHLNHLNPNKDLQS